MCAATIHSALLVLAVTLTAYGGSDPSSPAPTPPPGGGQAATLRVGLMVSSVTTWTQIKQGLRAGDFVVVSAQPKNVPGSIALAQQIAQDVPGIHVVFGDRAGGLNSVTTMDAYLTATPLPLAIEYVIYDFEPGFQPEFTFDEPTALPFFEQAHAIAMAHGKKVFPTPFNPFRLEAQPLPWDMGEIAHRSDDAMDVQLQQDLPPGLSVYQSDVLRVRDDVRAIRPDIILLVQLSFSLDTASDITAAATWIKTVSGVDGIFIIFDPNNPAPLLSLLQTIR